MAAQRLRDRQRLIDEVAELAADETDRAEAAEVWRDDGGSPCGVLTSSGYASDAAKGISRPAPATASS